MSHLFDPLALRSLTLSNRIVVSPMCQYSSEDGFSNDWHFVHLGTRAVGGASLVMTEATAVTAAGRISPHDLGIYDERHVEGLARCVRFIHAQKTLAGTQLAHAGRKASTARPWEGGGAVAPDQGGWEPVGPAGEPFASTYPTPRALVAADLTAIVAAFRTAAGRALDATVSSIRGSLKKGDTVTLVGFGSFFVGKRIARQGRNPRTGAAIKIRAAKVPKFRAGKALKDAVN